MWEKVRKTGASASLQKLTQHVLEDAAMPVVLELDRGIDSRPRIERRFAARPAGANDHAFTGRELLLDPRHRKGFFSSQPEARARLTVTEFERQDAHADQVRAMDALVALGDHRANSQQKWPF